MYILTKTKAIEGAKPKRINNSKGYKPNTDYNSLMVRYFKHVMNNIDKCSDLTIEKQDDIYVATFKKTQDCFSFNNHGVFDLSNYSETFNKIQRVKNENEFKRSRSHSKYLHNKDIERFILLYAPTEYQRFIDDDFDLVLLKGMNKDLLDYGKTIAIQTPPSPTFQLQYKMAEGFENNLGLIDVGVRKIINPLFRMEIDNDNELITTTNFEVELDYKFYYSFDKLSNVWSK